MSYDFSFDKKSAILIMIGCVVISVLLFLAGLIVGLDKGQNQATVQASSSTQNQQEARSASAKQPTIPLPEKLAATAKPAAGQPAPASTATSDKPASKETKEAPAAAAEGKAAAAPGSSAKEGDTKDQEKPAFSLQLGAFQTENNAVK